MTQELFLAFPVSQISKDPFRGCLAQGSRENGHLQATPTTGVSSFWQDAAVLVVCQQHGAGLEDIYFLGVQ